MGVLVRKRDGVWWVFINHRGERKAKKVGDKQAADTVAKKVREALATGALQIAKADAPLFRDYAVAWLQQHRRVNGIKEATAENYEKSIRRYLIPTFGAIPLTGIDRAAVKGFIARLRESGSVRRPGQGLSFRVG